LWIIYNSNIFNLKVTIIGGGIIGLTSAYYLFKRGVDVQIIERGNGEEGCSFGNAGYVSPSHFIPLASPGIIEEGIKFMMDSRSPFYIQPRLDMGLIKWGINFWRSSSKQRSQSNALALHHLLQLSRRKMIELAGEFDNPFQLEEKGCLMMYRKEQTGHHEEEMAEQASKLGIKTQNLSYKELKEIEPLINENVLGAVWYEEDCHIDPTKYMQFLRKYLLEKGVQINNGEEVRTLKALNNKVTQVETNKSTYAVDQILIATGAWLPQLTKDLGETVLLQAGKGYSTTVDRTTKNIQRPAILVDDRIALTPLGNKMRIGGTMEIAGINSNINMNRVEGIINAVNTNLDIKVAMPSKEEVWYGLRPCSPDGLPYISRANKHENLYFAGGHAMLGVSLAAATGHLLSGMISQSGTEIDIQPFRMDRF
jgi:D-amino-acid dehydrogenase